MTKEKSQLKALKETDTKKLRTLFGLYGSKLIVAELNKIAEGPPHRRVGAPGKIHPMSYVAVYLDVENRKIMKNGNERKRPLSLSKACDELAGVLNTFTADAHYASKTLQAMYRTGKKLRDGNPSLPALTVTLGRSSDGHQIKIPGITREIASDGSVYFPIIDRFGRGGRD